jgi:SAM-dependent methyltransferase
MNPSIAQFFNTDIGTNAVPLLEVASNYTNSTFVDLGVRTGVSSAVLLMTDETNKVFGVDVDWKYLEPSVGNNPRYTKILGDSSTVGKYWETPIQGLFVDTFHIKEQVMSELYHWYPHVVEGGFIAFHDSNWPEGKCDTFNNESWPRVEEGIKDFFDISYLNYEDEFIRVCNYPKSWGMTIVTIKKKKDFIKLYKSWKNIFERRNHLISLFWNSGNKNNVVIDLEINV